jgi:hypothetical protein
MHTKERESKEEDEMAGRGQEQKARGTSGR